MVAISTARFTFESRAEQNEALGRCLVPRKYNGPAVIFVSFFISGSTEPGKIPLGESREDEKTVNLLYFMRSELLDPHTEVGKLPHVPTMKDKSSTFG